MSETLFYATFQGTNKQGDTILSDRREYFKVKKSLFEFYLWLESRINELEKNYDFNYKFITTNIQYYINET